MRRFFERLGAAALVLGIFYAVPATAQLPLPVQEQVQVFNSLPQAQQQALIREVLQGMSPTQRDVFLSMLQQGRGAPTTTTTQAPVEQTGLSQPSSAMVVPEEPRFAAGDTLVIDFTLVATDDNEPDVALQEFAQRLADGNPYELDSNGVLYLPGVPAIPLAGLNVDEATVRVRAEPTLRPFTETLTRLPLTPVGTEALPRFGYELFDNVPSTFAPATDIPVPVDYVIGPGDTVNVQLFGSQNNEYFLEVSRDGVISFPDIGPLNVSGLTFAELRDLINQRVSQQYIDVNASTTLGELRSIRVFVSGDVRTPGSYTVSGLSTLTNALFSSGGVTPIGSLRNVRLVRDGVTQSTLDLYDLLLRGDTSDDVRLQPGDVIFVPPVGPTVAISGEVKRPAVYELRDERTLAELISLAGGLTAAADPASVKLERIVAGRGTRVSDVNLTDAAGQSRAIQDGDIVRIQENLPQVEDTVRLEGNVYQPGSYEWHRGMRLSELISSPERLKPKSDLNYVLIRRETEPNVDTDVLSADLSAAWAERGGAADVELESRDTVYVFNYEDGRQHIIEPIMEELKAQLRPGEAQPVATIGGRVRAPGNYPLEAGMRVSDLLRAGGGLSDAAYEVDAELTRYAVVDGEFRQTQLVIVSLGAILSGNRAEDVELQPYDYLNIKELPQWSDLKSVTIEGEVLFPGTYPIKQGENLSSVLARAGGLTEYAFPQGSIFTRVELAAQQRERLATLAQRIESDLATLSLSGVNNSDTMQTGQQLLEQIKGSVATGRLVIDLDAIVAGRQNADIILQDGDRLLIPELRQEVSVLGEVQYPTSHLYANGLNIDDYIGKSGGFTQHSDKRRTYVVRANGEVIANQKTRWFSRGSDTSIRPGDTIVVPLNLNRPLAKWSAVTQIVYNLAIAAAAVNSF